MNEVALTHKRYLESKNRILPIVDVQGDHFVFDIDSMALYQKHDPANVILFHAMDNHGSHYGFQYDLDEKNFPHDSIDTLTFDTIPANPDRAVYVEIPRMGEIDPEGMAAKYGRSINEVKAKTDFEIIVDQDAFKRRMSGEPISIDFPGQRFLLDYDQAMLTPQDGKSKPISLNSIFYLYYNEETGKYRFPYNPETRRPQEPDYDKITDYPKHLIPVEFPHQGYLDPIGFNLQMGNKPDAGLMYSNVRMNYKVDNAPWKAMGINHIIDRNRLELEKKNQSEPSPKKLIAKQPRRGRGL